jgi:hypothetical protein
MSEVTTIRVDRASLGSLHQPVREAAGPLVWLLDAGAGQPEAALPALLEHAPGPAASLPVDAAARPIEPLMGRVTEWDDDGILEAIQRRRLPLRYIPVISLLVERKLVLGLAPPDPRRFGWYAGAEWTARLFARQPGVLVPASRVQVACQVGSPIHVLRAARAARWRRGETVRELSRSVVAAVTGG